jgi:class 3 adenylate cyclase
MQGRGGMFGRVLARFGLFKPVEVSGPSSTGARTLLAAAARNAEFAIHSVRGLVWIFVLVGITTWSGLPAYAAAVIGVALGGLWLLILRGLEGGRSFAITRYALIVLDGLFIARAIAARDLGSSEIGLLAGAFGLTPPPADVSAYVVPLLALLAISGALRLDLRIAGFVTFVATSAYVYYALAFRVAPDEALFLGAIVLLAGIVGLNGAWALRHLVLRMQEQAVLEAFLPESMSRELSAAASLERSGRLEEVTLLTCDIRGFTTLSEKLTPTDTVAFINAYLEAVCPAIVSAGGVIDKFMGDGVLAFFEGGGHAGRGLNAARRVAALSGKVKEAKTGQPIRLGVALHSGTVLVGTIGPRSRREYTIISDTVNTLSRLEELNKKFGSVICVSEKTLSEVEPEQRAGFNGPESVPIRGRAEAVNVYYYKAENDAALAQLQAAAEAQKIHQMPTPEQHQQQGKESEIVYWDQPKTT